MKSKKIAALLSVVVITELLIPNIVSSATVNEISSVQEIYNEDVVISNMGDFRLEDHENFEQYKQMFKVSRDEIESVESKGGHHANNTPENAVDENNNTIWETSTKNTDSFKNEFIVEFKELTEIERMTYKTRESKTGFLKEYEIYGSTTSEGDDFELIAVGSGRATSETVEITFEPTEVKRVKIVFLEADNGWLLTPDNGWASIAELGFYNDPIKNEIEDIFSNNLFTELKAEFNNIATIEVLETKIEGHPLREELMETLNLAKDIVNNVDINNRSEVITLSQRGNEVEDAKRTGQRYQGANLDLTGYYVMPGEDVEIYVDANKYDIMPQVVFAQVGVVDDRPFNPEMNYRFDLKPGKNIIQAPTGFEEPFAVYLANRALPDEQEYAPQVILRGNSLQEYPIYIDGVTSVEDYLEDVENHTGANMTDLIGHRFMVSAKNTAAQTAYIENGYSPLDLAREMANMISIFDRISGLSENAEDPINEIASGLYHAKFSNEQLIHATTEYVHGLDAYAEYMLSGDVYSWGMIHEFGHQMEAIDIMMLEVTNNIYSMETFLELGKEQPSIDEAQKELDDYLVNGGPGFEGEKGVKFSYFTQLIVLYQILNEFGIDTYTQAYKSVREEKEIYPELGRVDLLIAALSNITGYDLAPHYEYYNCEISEEAKEYTSQFKTLDKHLRYTTMSSRKMIEENVQTFTKDTQAIIKKVDDISTGTMLVLGTNDNNEGTVAYEVYKDEELIGITRNNLFKDTSLGESSNYKVVAYDYRGNKSIVSSGISSGDIELSKAGTYYASDVQWQSATTGWAEIGIDKSVRKEEKIKLNVDGTVTEFDKGIAVVPESRINYYIGDKGYDTFSTYIGADKNYSIGVTARASIYVDGEKVYESSSITMNNAEYVEIDLTGAKEIELVVTEGDDDSYGDFVAWADTKFTVTEKEIGSKPELEIEESITTTVGNPIEDLVGNIIARDEEDGDLTSEVIVTLPEDINFNKPGQYTLTYEVTDSDNNTTTKERYISVVDMRDYTFLTDYEWDSAVQSYKQAQKDVNVGNGGILSLTGANGEAVVYERGIGNHATSEIIYDLSDKNYDYFTSYVGIDRIMYGANKASSVEFQVYVDGEKKYDSGIMRSTDEQKFVEVSLTGAEELKLVVTDGGNGIGQDHATWGDAKLHFVNEERGSQTGLEEAIERAKSINDTEYFLDEINILNLAIEEAEGLLEKQEVVTQAEFDEAENKLNETIENLVSREDFTFLTDYNWASATQSYKQAQKDVNVGNGGVLSLTGENGEAVVYERGIGNHSTSEVIYDLSDKDYKYFTSYVCVDRIMYGANKASSITFEVYVDGEKRYDSGLMRSIDEQKFVEVNIDGASELKLVVTDGGNGIGQDHGTWGDTKIYSNK